MSRPHAPTVCAVIVTHNRCELLAESLKSVLRQGRPPDAVLVVDNASDDGTSELLRLRFPEVEVLRLEQNQGGAGGFHEGIRRGHRDGYDYLWLMDDDTIPRDDALEKLLAAVEEAPNAQLVVSKVVWTDGEMHPMNRPFLRWGAVESMVRMAESGGGLIPLRAATFVSLLLARAAVDRYDLPEKRYFIWSDDIEYTARILRHNTGYVATRSVAVHKTRSPHTAVNSGERFYFHVRNSIYMFRGPAWSAREKVSLIWQYLRSILIFLRHERFSGGALRVVARGWSDSVREPADPAGPYLRPG